MTPATAHRLQLISSELCPYVERSRIVLEEKQVPYEVTFVDLDDKPAWLSQISPRGQVPVLLVDDRPVFESMVINEMLEDLFPERPMFPEGAVSRGQARAWVVYCNDVLMPAGAPFFFGRPPEQRAAARLLLADAFANVDRQLAQPAAGRFLFGDAFGLVDAVYAPFFNRWTAVTEHYGESLLGEYPRLQRYAEELLAQPSVKRARAKNLVARMKTRLAAKDREREGTV